MEVTAKNAETTEMQTISIHVFIVLLLVHFVSARDDSAKASVRPDSRVAPVFDWRIAGHRPAPLLVAALLR